MEREKLQKILKIIGYIICGIQLVVSVITSIYLIRMKAFPTAFVIILIIVLAVLLVLIIIMQRWLTPGILGKFLSILISAMLVIACFYIDYSYKKLNDMSGVETKVDNVDVYVMAYDSAQNINDAGNYNFGILTTLDRENTNNIIKDIEDELGKSITITEYASPKELIMALYGGETQATILNYAYIGFVDDDEEVGDFQAQTRVIYNKNYESVVTTEAAVPENYLAKTEDVFTILINGVDTRGSTISNSNSDTNILVTVNRNTHQILMVTTPRDYYVPLSISGGVNDKLTHSGAYGIDVTVDTLEMLYNVNIDEYVRINFDGFIDIIDALGGVTVYSEYDFGSYDTDVTQMTYHFNQGYNTLNGKQALLFARERHAFLDGDRQRGKNQMALIEAILDKALSPDILKNYTQILDEVSGSVVTSMPYDDIADLVRFQLEYGGSWDIIKYSVTGYDAMSTTFSTGGTEVYVMIPDESTVDQAKQYFADIYEGKVIVAE